MQANLFISIVQSALAPHQIMRHLEAESAVVLERLARGGGATRWYSCANNSHLKAIEEQLRPGSVVSFYFDGRIRQDLFSPEVKANAAKIIAEIGEVVIGILNEDQVHINVELISGPNELDEFAAGISRSVRVFYGAFPARDNDGNRAVTIILPDEDGIVRAHPH